MSEELKTPIATIIKYADGTETVVHYNSLGEKVMSEEVKSAPVEEVAAPVETEAPAAAGEVSPESAPESSEASEAV